jgi:inhibitor of cysteine peptidase
MASGRWRMVSAVVIVAAVAALCACKAASAKPLQLTEEDDGRTVQMNSDGGLEVTLDGNPTTGFLWEVASEDLAVLQAVGENEFKANSTAIGSPGKVTLRFEAVKRGEVFLKLIYHRPFEKDTPPAKTFEVKVEVR